MCSPHDAKGRQDMVLPPPLFYSLSAHERAASHTSHTGATAAPPRGQSDTSVAPHIAKARSKPKHVCAECGKTFKRAHNLKIHGRLHTGARPYQCPFAACGKDFRWKSSIVSHINWHRCKMGEELPADVSVHKLKKAEAEDAAAEGGFADGFEMAFDGRREEKDDCTVVTQGCGSYQASAGALGVAELDCYNVLDVKEWEARQDGGRMGGGLMPSLSCCRMENEGSFGTFLD